MEKQNEFKIKVMERRRRQGAGRAEVDRRQTPLRIEVKGNEKTHQIRNEFFISFLVVSGVCNRRGTY